jgi:hypothetical protein
MTAWVGASPRAQAQDKAKKILEACRAEIMAPTGRPDAARSTAGGTPAAAIKPPRHHRPQAGQPGAEQATVCARPIEYDNIKNQFVYGCYI